jgi:hypothetical protein
MKLISVGLGFAILAVFLVPLAQAQSTKSGSNSTSHSSAASAAQGGTGGSVTVEQNYYGTGGAASGRSAAAAGGSGGSSGGSGSNDYTATVHNTPDVAPPGQFGGTNPCAVGVSGGVSVAGVGIGGGGTWGSDGCERRNSAVILFQAGMPDVAVALLCQDSEIRQAFRDAGKPCPQDRPKERVADARPSDGNGSAAPVAAVQAAAATVQPVADSRPAWCSQPVRTEADQATYNYYCKLKDAVAAGSSAVVGAKAAAVSMR